ncbi:hypothetical protein [Thiomicrorhabdus indica]|uniref:hypothetical protein n=1 Tax=Thiomicrorhabdus indica TaxID=2267253 RepID=UPI00102D9E19|nr:hypothetical protein [Thiomicrorhabdus indica]
MSIKTMILKVSAAITVILALSACSNAEQQACLDKASKLWDNKTNDKNANQAYWQAVEACKEKYP